VKSHQEYVHDGQEEVQAEEEAGERPKEGGRGEALLFFGCFYL
jgi:hypothetical protein